MSTIDIRIDRLIGRQVVAGNGRRVGRLEDIRTETQGTSLVVTGFVIGVAGLLERLGIGVKLMFGRRAHGNIARWDQIDLSDPERPRLMCAIEDLRADVPPADADRR